MPESSLQLHHLDYPLYQGRSCLLSHTFFIWFALLRKRLLADVTSTNPKLHHVLLLFMPACLLTALLLCQAAVSLPSVVRRNGPVTFPAVLAMSLFSLAAFSTSTPLS